MDNLGAIRNNFDIENATIIKDNAPVLRGAVCGAHDVRFLPAYSPFLNPIENAFGVFKLIESV